MKHLLIIFALLLISCGSTTAFRQRTLSEILLEIAEVLPLKKDSADMFLSGFFTPSDSLKITRDGDFVRYTGKTFSLISSVNEVQIWPASGQYLQLPLAELSASMDSAWQDFKIMPEAKEPPPAIMAWYTDHLHRKKKIEIMGPLIFHLSQDSIIYQIRIIAN